MLLWLYLDSTGPLRCPQRLAIEPMRNDCARPARASALHQERPPPPRPDVTQIALELFLGRQERETRDREQGNLSLKQCCSTEVLLLAGRSQRSHCPPWPCTEQPHQNLSEDTERRWHLEGLPQRILC